MRAADRLCACPIHPNPTTPIPEATTGVRHSRVLGGDGPGALEFVLERLELGTAGHQPGELVDGDLVLGERAHRLAAVEDQEPVADRVGVARVVGDEDHGQTLLAGFDDALQHDARLLDTEGRGGLVEDQHLGAEVAGAGDGDRLALAARQRADRLFGVADVDAHAGHLFLGDPLGLTLVDPPSADPPILVGSAPRKKFRHTDISGTIARSWYTVAMPASSASRGELKRTSSPFIRMVPSDCW